ncbi:MAG: 4Fe-4S dicluster domain-containing protein, partial [Desulfobacterales bacterium]|nr:4Fe-4S dicluster domain-containing protein [Desulfobacterales bacterium]
MFYTITLYASLAIFGIGLGYRISAWFRYKTGPDARNISVSTRVGAAIKGIILTLFSAKIGILFKVFILNVLLQAHLLRKDFLRWLAHICIFGGFMLLLLMHALEKYITSVLFAEYYSTLNPFMFLRDLFGAMVIVGLALVLYRRFFSKKPRPTTSGMDYYAIIILAAIMILGVLLEATKIVSHSRYEEMVEEYAMLEEEEAMFLEAYWVEKFSVISPDVKGPFDKDTLEEGKELHEMSCASCHSRPQWAFMGYAVARVIQPVYFAHTFMWYLHFLACFIGLAYLPFSKFFHIFATPATLLLNAVMEPGKSDPANIATKQAIELDACIHCGDCTARCSVAVAFKQIPNPNILPSEKLAVLRALASGKKLPEKQLRIIQEGIHICTDCHRCTDVCPAGINLEDLWFSMRDNLAQLGYPKPEVWARERMGAHFDLTRLKAQTLSLTPVDRGFLGGLGASAQAGTFSVCFGCENCTNVCPVVGNYENPGEVLGLVPH